VSQVRNGSQNKSVIRERRTIGYRHIGAQDRSQVIVRDRDQVIMR